MPVSISSLLQIYGSDLSRPVDIYCERVSQALDAEPLNALSNIAFLVAAWAAWRLQGRRYNPVVGRWVRFLSLWMVVVGIGSAVFHTVATRWAEWADVIPILIFMLSYCWLILTVFFRLGIPLKIAILAAFFAATFYLESDEFEYLLWGGAMYLPTFAVLGGAALALWKLHPEFGKTILVALALFVLSFAARTADMPLCGVLPVGTHYFWHILNATVLFLLVRAVILHARERPVRAQPASSLRAEAKPN
jgi:hypothetical protein